MSASSLNLPTTASNSPADFFKWAAPRTIAITIGGYYGLGIAYEMGLMALIDQFAIQVLKNIGGYAGIGALMPTVQWYSAWAARISIGIAAGILYDLAERIVVRIYFLIPASWTGS